ncbi:hypothetical protein C7410_10846 [Paraburkholderia silvatlantica]|uniref:Uncharacterized protein n=1 Tax=Paraburkholderia silvatlantica TaxID=321895 RepID=A0A2V4TC42_9BURK|nr:hypothetical protein [Paraburkholderia silvatlantica]PYE23149.1 hypothetical protein C7410_10846 [Paraburkholderia silvatlantica]
MDSESIYAEQRCKERLPNLTPFIDYQAGAIAPDTSPFYVTPEIADIEEFEDLYRSLWQSYQTALSVIARDGGQPVFALPIKPEWWVRMDEGLEMIDMEYGSMREPDILRFDPLLILWRDFQGELDLARFSYRVAAASLKFLDMALGRLKFSGGPVLLTHGLLELATICKRIGELEELSRSSLYQASVPDMIEARVREAESRIPDLIKERVTEVASKGGRAKANKFAPIKAEAQKLARERVPSSGKWKSRAEAARKIRDEVQACARALGQYLSDLHVQTTIDGWLKEMPEANILFGGKSEKGNPQPSVK